MAAASAVRRSSRQRTTITDPLEEDIDAILEALDMEENLQSEFDEEVTLDCV